jgi:hypothetical protein
LQLDLPDESTEMWTKRNGAKYDAKKRSFSEIVSCKGVVYVPDSILNERYQLTSLPKKGRTGAEPTRVTEHR